MDNPIEILYSWQALLVALTASGLTQLTKTIYDISKGSKEIKKGSVPPPVLSPPSETAESPYRDPVLVKPAIVGKETRKANLWLNRVIFPMVPIFFGALLGAFLPLHPEVLVTYVDAHVEGAVMATLVYATWGAACGQFADYIFSKAKAVMSAFAKDASTPKPPTGTPDEV
jgi:hypothetical protein